MKIWWTFRRAASPDHTIDERFTNLADFISEAMGRWRASAFCLLLIVIWAAFGPFTGYSDSWQLWVNTPTTVAELFLGFFTLAAANRVEKRNYDLHRGMMELLRKLDTITMLEQDEIEEILELERGHQHAHKSEEGKT